MGITYEQYLEQSELLVSIADKASYKLQQYPTDEMGLTPEHVRLSPQFRADKQAYSVSAKALQVFNHKYVKVYGKRRASEKRKLRTKTSI